MKAGPAEAMLAAARLIEHDPQMLGATSHLMAVAPQPRAVSPWLPQPGFTDLGRRVWDACIGAL